MKFKVGDEVMVHRSSSQTVYKITTVSKLEHGKTVYMLDGTNLMWRAEELRLAKNNPWHQLDRILEMFK
jgi:hypothetical protein